MINNRKLTAEELQRLCDFFLLLYQIDRRINPDKYNINPEHGEQNEGSLPVPEQTTGHCSNSKLLHDAPSSPYSGISLYGHIKFSKTKKNPLRKNGKNNIY